MSDWIPIANMALNIISLVVIPVALLILRQAKTIRHNELQHIEAKIDGIRGGVDAARDEIKTMQGDLKEHIRWHLDTR